MTGRRAFIGGAMASALAGCEWSRAFRSPAVGNRLPVWRPGEYQVHFIYTGRCESSFHIFPDGTSMLLDCGTANRKRNAYTLLHGRRRIGQVLRGGLGGCRGALPRLKDRPPRPRLDAAAPRPEAREPVLDQSRVGRPAFHAVGDAHAGRQDALSWRTGHHPVLHAAVPSVGRCGGNMAGRCPGSRFRAVPRGAFRGGRRRVLHDQLSRGRWKTTSSFGRSSPKEQHRPPRLVSRWNSTCSPLGRRKSSLAQRCRWKEPFQVSPKSQNSTLRNCLRCGIL